jgi:hypothetical protein
MQSIIASRARARRAPRSAVTVSVDSSVGAISVHRPREIPVRIRVSGAVASAEVNGPRSGAVHGGTELIAGTWTMSMAGDDIEGTAARR